MKNKIREFREKLGLSQKQIAAAAGTSQQQIQRIESGVQSARFDIAARICAAINTPMEKVFPATKSSLKRLIAKGKTLKDLPFDEKAAEELGNAGIDMEFKEWTLKIMLRNGYEGFHKISSKEKSRLWSAVQRSDGYDRFVVYDTDRERIALNLNHLIFAQFLFDPPYSTEPEVGYPHKIKFFISITKNPLEFSVDPDWADSAEGSEDETASQLQHLFFTAELSCEDDDTVSFCDDDGEVAFFRLSDVAMISAPLNHVEPALLHSEMEEYDENEDNMEQEK